MLGKAWVRADYIDDVNSDDLVRKILAGRGVCTDEDVKKWAVPANCKIIRR